MYQFTSINVMNEFTGYINKHKNVKWQRQFWQVDHIKGEVLLTRKRFLHRLITILNFQHQNRLRIQPALTYSACHNTHKLPVSFRLPVYCFVCFLRFLLNAPFFPTNFLNTFAVLYLLFQRIWSIVLTCATATLYATLFQCNGIPAISAHCTNSANIHASFHRNFSQTYTMNAEQTVTAFLRTGQNARYVFSLIQNKMRSWHPWVPNTNQFLCVRSLAWVYVCKKIKLIHQIPSSAVYDVEMVIPLYWRKIVAFFFLT